MGWLRNRLARLGVRGPFGRDAVAAALAVLGLARIPVTLLVNGGRLPVPAWPLAAANLASTADVGTIALRRRTPRDGPRPGHGGRVVATALPVRHAMTGLGLLVCAYTVGTLLPWRRATAASCGITGLLGAYVQTRRAYTAELLARAERLAGRGPAARTPPPGGPP